MVPFQRENARARDFDISVRTSGADCPTLPALGPENVAAGHSVPSTRTGMAEHCSSRRAGWTWPLVAYGYVEQVCLWC